jgi:hypothetical protein
MILPVQSTIGLVTDIIFLRLGGMRSKMEEMPGTVGQIPEVAVPIFSGEEVAKGAER